MNFPAGLVSPAGRSGDAALCGECWSTNLTHTRRRSISDGSKRCEEGEGQEDMGTGAKLFFGFLAVMFLYLFIPMARHHRSLHALSGTKDQS